MLIIFIFVTKARLQFVSRQCSYEPFILQIIDPSAKVARGNRQYKSKQPISLSHLRQFISWNTLTAHFRAISDLCVGGGNIHPLNVWNN